jgi:hypothetical protein
VEGVGVLFCFGVGERVRDEVDGMDGVVTYVPVTDSAAGMEGRNTE